MLTTIIKYGLMALGVFLLLSGVITGGNSDRKLSIHLDYGKVFDTFRDKESYKIID